MRMRMGHATLSAASWQQHCEAQREAICASGTHPPSARRQTLTPGHDAFAHTCHLSSSREAEIVAIDRAQPRARS